MKWFVLIWFGLVFTILKISKTAPLSGKTSNFLKLLFKIISQSLLKIAFQTGINHPFFSNLLLLKIITSKSSTLLYKIFILHLNVTLKISNPVSPLVRLKLSLLLNFAFLPIVTLISYPHSNLPVVQTNKLSFESPF